MQQAHGLQRGDDSGVFSIRLDKVAFGESAPSLRDELVCEGKIGFGGTVFQKSEPSMKWSACGADDICALTPI